MNELEAEGLASEPALGGKGSRHPNKRGPLEPRRTVPYGITARLVMLYILWQSGPETPLSGCRAEEAVGDSVFLSVSGSGVGNLKTHSA